jgi:hypothetical protein
MLEGDYGFGAIQWEGTDKRATKTKSKYRSSGKYFRVGLNYNLLKDTPDKNAAFLGVRYAMSFFDDWLTSKISYDSKGVIDNGAAVSEHQKGVSANWLEAVAGVKVKVWRFLYVGGTVRYKFWLGMDRADRCRPYDILGWGLNEEQRFGFSYYLSVRIPFGGDAPSTESTPAITQ